jgi:hypothetical protein
MTTADEIFLEVPHDIDVSWRHGALVGGMVDLAIKKRGVLAASFKRAGDTLLAASLANDTAHELLYPILFNYRHSIELFLKSTSEPAHRNHDLTGLVEHFRRVVREQLGAEVPGWIVESLNEFHDVDGRSTTFRYPEAGAVFKSGRLQGEV